MHTAQQPVRLLGRADATTPPEFTTSAELKAHYRKVRERMRGSDPLPVAHIPRAEAGEREQAELEPETEAIPLPDETLPPDPIPVVSRDKILRAVAVAAKVNLCEMRSHLRCRPLVNARFVYYVLARRYSGASLLQIGYVVGYRDHSTVLHGLKMGAKNFEQLRPIYTEACEALGIPLPDVRPFLGIKK